MQSGETDVYARVQPAKSQGQIAGGDTEQSSQKAEGCSQKALHVQTKPKQPEASETQLENSTDRPYPKAELQRNGKDDDMKKSVKKDSSEQNSQSEGCQTQSEQHVLSKKPNQERKAQNTDHRESSAVEEAHFNGELFSTRLNDLIQQTGKDEDGGNKGMMQEGRDPN